MIPRKKVGWQILVSFFLLASLISPGFGWAAPAPSEPQDLITIALDGVRDAGYVKIASDPAGDLGDPGGWTGTQWTDLTSLYVAADEENLYVYVDLPQYSSTTDSTGQIGLVMDVDHKWNSGGISDPWANAISFSFNTVDGFPAAKTLLPDYAIRGNIYGTADNGWTELRAWNGADWNTGSGANWGGIDGSSIGTHIAYADDQGVELAIPLADIGSPDPASVHLQFFTTQGGGSKGAYDTLPSDDQASGWDTPTTQTQLVSVPLAIDPAGDLASPGPGDFPGVAWTDLTRLHLWADHDSLQIFVPSEAYSQTLSTGQIGMAFDTRSGGGSSDPWGNAITYDYQTLWQNLGHTPETPGGAFLPDFMIRGNIFGPSDNGWTELREWNGSDWNTGGGTDWGGIGNSGQPSLPGSNVAWANADGLRLTIPFGDLEVAAGSLVNLEFFGTQGGGGKGAYDTVPSDDQTTGWDDPTTQTVLASYVIPTIPAPGSSHDNNVEYNGLGHNSQDGLYRVPFGALSLGDELLLRFRTFHNDVERVRVRFWDTAENREFFKDMQIAAGDEDCRDASVGDATCDYWQLSFTPDQIGTVYYRFIAIDGTATAYYADDNNKDGGWGVATPAMIDNSYAVTVFDPAFQPVEWMKDAVVYQIFPDRFRNGDLANDPLPNEPRYSYPPNELDRIWLKGWSELPEGHCRSYVNPAEPCDEAPRGRDYYGGDLAGLHSKLDYLEALGVKVIYLNPIFEAGSNHLYDTQDYYRIDHFFGDNDEFKALADDAHARGMKIILDGVFNHVSSDSPYMDRYGHFTEVGACESLDSPYRDWFTFHEVGAGNGWCAGADGPESATYDAWFGFDSLPVLNKYNQEVVDLIYDTNEAVARYWLDLGADGWRLDVMPDASFPADFWPKFRAAVLETKPDAIIIGELWKKGDVLPFIHGNKADTTMNYRFRNAVQGFLGMIDNKGFVDDGQSNQPPSTFASKMISVREDYPDATYYTLMNLLDSHDTERILWSLTPGEKNRMEKEFNSENVEMGKTMLRLATLIQMTVPGAPTIYYGDEVGVTGADDPDDRRTFPWQDQTLHKYYLPLLMIHNETPPAAIQPKPVQEYYGAGGDHDLLDWYRQVTGLRNTYPVFRDGELTFLLTDDANRTLAYLMRTPDAAAIVAINRSDTIQTLSIDVTHKLPINVELEDVLGDQVNITAENGSLSFELAPLSAVVWMPVGGQDLVAPYAPTDLAAEGGNGQVSLTWNGTAANYIVYRSPVRGGGYLPIGMTNTPSYIDLSVVNGRRYYYVVSGLDEAEDEGPYSNEAAATPAFPITDALIQWPLEIQHTLGITPTETIYGRVQVPGLTDSGGDPNSILAQVGFGAQGSDPTGWDTWVAMNFNVESGGYYEYMGNLRPEAVGEYDYLVRFSTNGGESWTLGYLLGGLPGNLIVLPNPDTTPPAAPADLRVTDWSSGFISLQWEAVADAGEYWLYRSEAAGGYGAPLAKLPASQLTYTDIDVNPGMTYYYVVRAVDMALNLSEPSNEVAQAAEPKMVSVTFRVKVPAFTPEADTVYLVGDIPDLGPWNPGIHPMTDLGGGIWETTLDILDGTNLQYKYTRGNWDRVEWWGSIVSVENRHVTIAYGPGGTQLIDNTAEDWGNGADSDKAVQNWRDPLIASTSPDDGFSGAAPESVAVVFSRAVQPPAGQNTFDGTITVEADGSPVAGIIAQPDDLTLTWTPAAALAAGTYTVTVSGVRSSLGNDSVPMQAAYTFTFTVVP